MKEFNLDVTSEKPPVSDDILPGYSPTSSATPPPPYQQLSSISVTKPSRGRKCCHVLMGILFVGLLVSTITLVVFVACYKKELHKCQQATVPKDNFMLNPIDNWGQFTSHITPCVGQRRPGQPSIDLQCVQRALTKQQWHIQSVPPISTPSLYKRILIHFNFLSDSE